jgi:hypothetical protein
LTEEPAPRPELVVVLEEEEKSMSDIVFGSQFIDQVIDDFDFFFGIRREREDLGYFLKNIERGDREVLSIIFDIVANATKDDENNSHNREEFFIGVKRHEVHRVFISVTFL